MIKRRKNFKNKILIVALACAFCSLNGANAEIIKNDKYIKIINDTSFQNITNM